MLPAKITPAELASHIGASERTVRELARDLGAYRKIGKAIFFLPEDIETIMEAAKCPTSSTSAVKSGTTVEALPDGDYAALLARRTGSSPSGSQRKPKPRHGVVTSMARGRT